MPYALCPMHVGYLMLLRKAIYIVSLDKSCKCTIAPQFQRPASCYTEILRLCAIGAIDSSEKNLKFCSLGYIYLVNDCLNSPSVDCVLSIILQNP
jgi:hypothetical protein